MIRITKSAAPGVLATQGTAKAEEHKAEYDSDPALYQSGDKKLAIDAGIYGHPDVKKALLDAQNGKCAFCESKITHIAYGDVEHYRPKKGYQQKRKDRIGRPGYYWLAYDWDNLFLACAKCNQAGKGNLFPLADPAKRAVDHKHDVGAEDALLVHPAIDEPMDHLAFNGPDVAARNGSLKGHATIEVLRLNRDELTERRRERFQYVRQLIRLLSLGAPEDDEARVWLRENVRPTGEYFAMLQANGLDVF